MRVLEVTKVQKMAAQAVIEIAEKLDRPVDEWTRRVAAATRRPAELDPELAASDQVVPYLV